MVRGGPQGQRSLDANGPAQRGGRFRGEWVGGMEGEGRAGGPAEVLQGRRLVFPGRRRCLLEPFTIEVGALGAGQVLLQTEISLMSTGTELANYSGLDPGVDRPGSWNAYPWRPGYAAVGRVLRLGPAAARQLPELRPGDRVFSITPHASHAVVDVGGRSVFRLASVEGEASGDDPRRLILVRMASVAMTALRLSRGAAPGGTAVVLGLGLVGNFAAQLFALAGLRVLAFDPAPRRVALARACGIRDAEDLTGEGARRRVLEWTGGVGADVVVEAIGNPRLIPGAVRMCRRLGEVILLGSPRGPMTEDTGELWSEIHHRGISVVGALEWLLPFKEAEAGRGSSGFSIERNYHTLIGWVRDGSLRVDGLLSYVVAPEACQETYDGVLADRNAYMGIAFDWTGGAGAADPPADGAR